MKNDFKLLALICAFFLSSFAYADGAFEMGEVSLTTTIDNSGWVSVALTSGRYTNPVVIAGPLTHNNDHSLSVRVRNVTSSSFEIGMQSPCESEGRVATGVTCPPASWLSETVQYLIIEEGVWVFPDGTKLEAHSHSTSAIRSSSGGTLDTLSYSHTYTAAPAVLHTVNTANVSYPSGHSNAGAVKWIASTVTGSSTTTAPSNTVARIALEGAEVSSSHGTESIAWVAIEQGSGTNNGFDYDAGRTSGLTIDRHSDGCYATANFLSGAGFAALPSVVMQHNSMQGGNGAWIRQCAAATLTSLNVHMEEDQVNDSERTGIPEYGAWFAFETGATGVLKAYVDLGLSQTINTESASIINDADSSGNVTPGDTVRFEITVKNDGSTTLNAITVTDVLPNAYLYASSSITGGDSRNDANPSTTGLTWTIASLLAGNFETLSFDAVVQASSVPSTYTNTATASSSSSALDSNPSNDSASVTPDVLRIVKYVCNESKQGDSSCDLADFAFSASGSPGETLVYRIEYENFATEVLDFDFSDNVPFFTTLIQNSYGVAGEARVECHANAAVTHADVDLGAVATVSAAIASLSVCNGSILPGESGVVLFKATIN